MDETGSGLYPVADFAIWDINMEVVSWLFGDLRHLL